jgi:hypothetical protein
MRSLSRRIILQHHHRYYSTSLLFSPNWQNKISSSLQNMLQENRIATVFSLTHPNLSKDELKVNKLFDPMLSFEQLERNYQEMLKNGQISTVHSALHQCTLRKNIESAPLQYFCDAVVGTWFDAYSAGECNTNSRCITKMIRNGFQLAREHSTENMSLIASTIPRREHPLSEWWIWPDWMIISMKRDWRNPEGIRFQCLYKGEMAVKVSC